MARAQGSNAQLAAVFETVYGTSPVSGFTKMPFVSTGLGDERQLNDSDVLGYGRDPVDPIPDATNVDGDIVIPMDAEYMGLWLKGLMGQPVTTGTTPKVHTYQSGSYALPSLSVEKQMPEVPSFEMFAGLNVDEMSWEMRRTGLLTATVRLIGQKMTRAATTQAGTLALKTYKRFGQFQGAVKRNGTLLGNITGARISYKNNLDRIDTIRADGLIDGADPTNATLSGSMEMRYANNDLLDDATNGTPVELVFSHTIDANNSFVLTAHRVFLPRPKTPIAGPKGIQLSFDWIAAQDFALSPSRMATVVLTNAVSGY